ncbi:MAG: DMT family transporter [Pseudomonadota bacterium]
MTQLAPAAAPGRRAGPAGLGIALMLLGMLLFALNDTLGKWLVATYTVGQVLLLRSATGLAILAPLVLRRGVLTVWRVDKPGLQVLRVALSTAEVFCFYWAVRFLPLADVMTFWLAAPIWVAMLSPFLLGERIGLRRWLAIMIGFGGVVIALAPSGELHPGATLVAIVGTLCFALMLITGRALRGTPDITLVVWQMAGALAVGLVLAPIDWVPPGAVDVALLCALGIVAMLGHLCVSRALKLVDAGVVAPFQYTLLPWAILLGWLFFGDAPRPDMLLGGAIIVSAGLYIFVRERRQAARQA